MLTNAENFVTLNVTCARSHWYKINSVNQLTQRSLLCYIFKFLHFVRTNVISNAQTDWYTGDVKASIERHVREAHTLSSSFSSRLSSSSGISRLDRLHSSVTRMRTCCRIYNTHCRHQQTASTSSFLSAHPFLRETCRHLSMNSEVCVKSLCSRYCLFNILQSCEQVFYSSLNQSIRFSSLSLHFNTI